MNAYSFSPEGIRKRTPEFTRRLVQKMCLDSPPAVLAFEKKPVPPPKVLTERERRNLVIVHRVQSWVDKCSHSCPTAPEILRLFECVERLISLMEYDFSKLLWPMLIYADTYVQRTAPVSQTRLFPLVIVAAALSMKMWEDYGPDLDLTAHVSGVSKRDISKLERDFLDKLNFSLNLQMSDLEAIQAVPEEPALKVEEIGSTSPRSSSSS